MEAFIFYSVIMLWVFQIFSLFALFLLFRQFGEVYLNTGKEVSKDGLPINKRAPDVSVHLLNTNERESLNQLINRPTLVTFVSPNCKPCEELIEDWNNATKIYGDYVHFYVVILGEENEVKQMTSNKHIAGNLIWDHNEELFHRFLVRVTPFAFAIDEGGTVRDKGLCGNKEQIELLVSSVLNNEE